MSEQERIELTTPAGSFKAYGRDTIPLLTLLVVALIAAAMYFHLRDAKDADMAVAITNKEVASAITVTHQEFVKALKELATSQKLATCLLGTDPEKREKEYMKPDSFCNRMSN